MAKSGEDAAAQGLGLTDEDIVRILKIVEASSFEFLQLESGGLRITLSKQGGLESAPFPAAKSPAIESSGGQGDVLAEPAPAGGRTQAAEAPSRAAAAPAPPADAQEDAAGIVPVTAPTVGIFYRAPEPGAPPFVDSGQEIDEATTVGLLEVMKMFTAVKARVKGTVERIVAADGTLVEVGQVLLTVRTH